MHRDDADVVRAQRLQHRLDLAVEHGNVAGNRRVATAAVEGRPRIQAHPRVDGYSHFDRPDDRW